MPIETGLWRHNNQHAMSHGVSEGISLEKKFSYVD